MSKLLARLRKEPLLIAALVLASGGVWVFCEVVDEVVEGDSTEIDERIVLAFRNPQDANDPIGPKWVEELMRDFTALGGIGVLTLATIVAFTFMYVQGYRRHALVLLVALVSGLVISLVAKQLFDRPRPDLVSHGSHVYTKSFPSGHSMLSAVFYLTLGAVLAEFVKPHPLKVFLVVTSILITVAVGVSRVYLGVHYPTDVLAGWALGGAWAMACWAVARLLHLKPIDPEDPAAQSKVTG